MEIENKIIIFGACAMEFAVRFRISMALMEIIIGAFIGYLAFKLNFTDKLTLIANKFFLPKHLLEEPILDDQPPEIMPKHK